MASPKVDIQPKVKDNIKLKNTGVVDNAEKTTKVKKTSTAAPKKPR